MTERGLSRNEFLDKLGTDQLIEAWPFGDISPPDRVINEPLDTIYQYTTPGTKRILGKVITTGLQPISADPTARIQEQYPVCFGIGDRRDAWAQLSGVTLVVDLELEPGLDGANRKARLGHVFGIEQPLHMTPNSKENHPPEGYIHGTVLADTQVSNNRYAQIPLRLGGQSKETVLRCGALPFIVSAHRNPRGRSDVLEQGDIVRAFTYSELYEGMYAQRSSEILLLGSN
jgi:hypothetical protein